MYHLQGAGNIQSQKEIRKTWVKPVKSKNHKLSGFLICVAQLSSNSAQRYSSAQRIPNTKMVFVGCAFKLLKGTQA